MAEWADNTVSSAALVAQAGQSHGYKEILAAIRMLREAQATPRAASPARNANAVNSLKRALDRWENEGGR